MKTLKTVTRIALLGFAALSIMENAQASTAVGANQDSYVCTAELAAENVPRVDCGSVQIDRDGLEVQYFFKPFAHCNAGVGGQFFERRQLDFLVQIQGQSSGTGVVIRSNTPEFTINTNYDTTSSIQIHCMRR